MNELKASVTLVVAKVTGNAVVYAAFVAVVGKPSFAGESGNTAMAPVAEEGIGRLVDA